MESFNLDDVAVRSGLGIGGEYVEGASAAARLNTRRAPDARPVSQPQTQYGQGFQPDRRILCCQRPQNA
ncbi:hypothetical protein ACFQI9_23240 [Paraburkholderia dipogonis]|uniref:hypothetical protein n=1 Tax=Paraburkholderia dipogonis TaxID=1211383 RepID=UPI00361029DD